MVSKLPEELTNTFEKMINQLDLVAKTMKIMDTRLQNLENNVGILYNRTKKGFILPGNDESHLMLTGESKNFYDSQRSDNNFVALKNDTMNLINNNNVKNPFADVYYNNDNNINDDTLKMNKNDNENINDNENELLNSLAQSGVFLPNNMNENLINQNEFTNTYKNENKFTQSSGVFLPNNQ